MNSFSLTGSQHILQMKLLPVHGTLRIVRSGMMQVNSIRDIGRSN